MCNHGLSTVLTISYELSRTHLYFAALSAGVVGLTLSYAIKISGVFQQCVKQSAEVENLVRPPTVYFRLIAQCSITNQGVSTF